MRALSLRQPWLYCITEHGKRIENRTWKAPDHIIGQRIALHASAAKHGKEWRAVAELTGIWVPWSAVVTGAITATAVVAGQFRSGWEPDELDLEQQKWVMGPWCWILKDVVKLDEPIPAKGMLGLWRVPEQEASWIRPSLERRGSE